MALTSRLTSNGSGVDCCVCRNLDYHSSLPVPLAEGGGDMRVPGSFKYADFSRSFSKLEKSADQGCPVCWVLASIRRLWDDSIDTATELRIDLGDNRDVRLGCRYFYLHLDLRKDNPSGLGVSEETSSLFQSLRVKADISESPWSETAQLFARTCIRMCIEHHDLCGLGESLLPRRVIEVGNVGDDHLQLYEAQKDTPGRYIALSYCWGGDQMLKTTSANIGDMMSRGSGLLRLSHLPQTLADAVHVTRSLGIQYLWVDALCIIQDNFQDWERESAQMALIYEKAYLVIAAASSSSVTEGFINQQRQKRGLRFDIHSTYGSHSSVIARQQPRSGLHQTLSDEMDPLAQRAWAFQEQHMSTRCLIFSEDEMQWVCKKNEACECGETFGKTDYLPTLPVGCDDTRQGDEANHQLELQDMWHMAVELYSFRRLTHSEDKLPAFSGFASRFGASLGFRYVAGLWEQTVLRDLMWGRSLGLTPLPIRYRAPSFSWVSIDCGVDYNFARRRWTSRSLVSDIEAIVPGHNPFGKVKDAWITIQGPVVRGTIHGSFEYPRFCSDDRELYLSIELDCPLTVFRYATAGNSDEISVRRCHCLSPSEDSRKEAPEHNDKSSSMVEPFQEGGTMDNDFPPASVWLLHLGRSIDRTSSQSGDVGYSTDFYLVLGKSAYAPQKYERIGYCDPLSEETLDKHNERFITKTITIV